MVAVVPVVVEARLSTGIYNVSKLVRPGSLGICNHNVLFLYIHFKAFKEFKEYTYKWLHVYTVYCSIGSDMAEADVLVLQDEEAENLFQDGEGEEWPE